MEPVFALTRLESLLFSPPSILFLTLLSVLRWLAVCLPYRHRTLATPTRVLLVCVGIWVFVGVSSVPFLSHGVTTR